MTNKLDQIFEIEGLKDSFTISDMLTIKSHLLSSLISDVYDKKDSESIVIFINAIDRIIIKQLTKIQ